MHPVPAARRLALPAVIAVLTVLLALPGFAAAQSTTVPQLAPTVTTPVPKPAKKPSVAKGQLPNTGVDARLIAAVGIALLLCGVGLRMRSADEHF
jgi:LPXTG-motif cell wall-anchored protein